MDTNNIIFFLDEMEQSENVSSEIDFDNLLSSLSQDNTNSTNTNNTNNSLVNKIIQYNLEYNKKDLLNICDYYGLNKEIKNLNKYNKDIILQHLISFEINPKNIEVVSKRQTMWFYMNELKNDRFMKKYIIW